MKNSARVLLLILGDLASLLFGFLAMYALSASENRETFLNLHLTPFSLLIIVWFMIFFVFNLYDTHSTKPTIPNLKNIFYAFFVFFIVSIIFFYTIPYFQITPKTNLAIFSFSSILIFLLWRRVFYNIFSKHFRKNIVFIYNNPNKNQIIKDIIKYTEEHPQSGFQYQKSYNSIEEVSENTEDCVLVINKDVWKNKYFLKNFYAKKCEIIDLAQIYENLLGRIPVEGIDENWFMHRSDIGNPKITEYIYKFIDKILAFSIIVLLFPIFILISLLVKVTDGGKILYKQDRVGRYGRIFTLYKFRSMTENAEKDGPVWSPEEDDRTTKIGKVLRKTHLDELPQMFNVLKGDIMLVGPRPERPEFVEKLEKEIPFYHLRHIITPGFTGWAQIKFRYARSVMDAKTKFEYDLYYLKNRNIFMDIGILLRTIQIIFTH